MRTPFKSLRAILLILVLSCSIRWADAQNATPGVTPELAHRIEAVLLSKIQFPPATSFSFGTRTPSEIPGFDRIEVRWNSSLGGGNGTFPLLISKDGSRLAQFTSYDISVDPKEKFQAGDRPPRGGPEDAPVLIVGFDDLECPFCARLNAELFPALLDHYKDLVRIVYRSFPEEGHPWAMRAAVDADCLGSQSARAYWAAVDEIHSHSSEYGGTGRSLAKAKEEIDAEVRKQGQAFHVDGTKLDACIAKQDTTAEIASVRLGEQLGVESTPTIFINGVKVVGALPVEYIFGLIDDALRAEGKAPPPPYAPSRVVAPTPMSGAAAPPKPKAQ
jgi:protein-disulfide isomerase